jgi:hypothetical protein
MISSVEKDSGAFILQDYHYEDLVPHCFCALSPASLSSINGTTQSYPKGGIIQACIQSLHSALLL